MNHESDPDGYDKAVGSHGQKRGPGWFRSPGLFDPNAASRPSKHHPYLPVITRQVLLDTSDSESERSEPACKSGDSTDSRIPPHKPRPSLQSPTRNSGSESIRSGTNLISKSSSSKVPGSINNLKFVPSPHPYLIQHTSIGSGSSKSGSAAESSSNWKNPGPSQLPVSHRFDTTHNAMVASIAESMDASVNFVSSALPKSRFTFKTSSSVPGNTKKRMHSCSIDVSSKIESKVGCSQQIIPRQSTGLPSRPLIMDQSASGRFDDETNAPRHTSVEECSSSYSDVECAPTTNWNFREVTPSRSLGSKQAFQGSAVNVPCEPVMSGLKEGIPRRDQLVSRGIRNFPSSSKVEPPTVNQHDAAVAFGSHQKTNLHPAVKMRSDSVPSKHNQGHSGRHDVALGDPRNGPPSSQISVQSILATDLNYADVAMGSFQNPGTRQTGSHQATYMKLEPTFGPGSVGSSQHSSPMLQNLSSTQIPELGQVPIMGFTDVGSIGVMPPVNSPQTILHQSSNSRPEQVGLNHIVSGRHDSRSINPRNTTSSSLTLATCQASISSGGNEHLNRSYLGSNVGFGNKDFSGSNGNVSSDQGNVDTNPGNSDSSNLERQISSELSDSGVVFMSLVHKKNKIAGSSYNSSTGQVHLLESVTENFEFSTTVLAMRSASPSIVVVPTSGATRFVKELKAKIEGDPTLKDCQIQCLSPRYFAYSFARRTVLESSLWEGCLTFRSEDAKKNAIVSNINLNDERLVCAFGGLLYHLSTGCPQLGPGMSPLPITSVQHMKLINKLWLDTESFKNLQIFDPAEHPSSFKWSSTNRDHGKSIFGLFERFCSSVGMTKLKSFLANPVHCRIILEKRHEVMKFYLDPSNFNAMEALRSFTSQMSSSSVIMSYLSSPTLRGGHWKHIYRHIYYTVSYAEVCRSHGDQSELFRELGSTIVDAVYSMAHNLERVVDLVNMVNNETFVIKYGFHPPLDAAKEKFSRLKMAMDKVTPYEFDSVPSFISRIQMMYIPEMKFLLSIPYWAPDLSKEELTLPNLEFKFTANRTAFYKSRRCYELDELLGDAQTDIINEESMIIQSLRNYLKKHMHHIVGMAQKIAEIECIFALAKVAKEERYTKPDIVDCCVTDIRGGWHPLLDVPSNEVITNDLVSSADTSLVKLIYGPNASGKSIYLKEVGLIMYLVHVGSYVPAVSARIGLFGRILARTTTEESVISMSSTMLSELKKLQDAVMGCAKDTLVILDEVGKGSTEENCIAIVTSAVNYFLSRGSDCPHVLISTHLSGISDFVMSPPHSDEGRNLFELLIMDYTVTDGEVVFLYKVRRGSPDSSFVFEVLENSEFAAPIVKTARTVLEALRTGENFLPYCETRIQRSHKYLNFIRKFVNIDMAKPGYLEKLQNKIQRYYEKPSY